MEEKAVTNTCEKHISDILMSLGFEPNLLGYHFTLVAVQMMVENPVSVIKAGMTKYLYPEVGKKFGYTASQVERAIRHAIDKAYKPERPAWRAIYKKGVPPTNSLLIATLAEAIRLEKVS